MGEFRAQDAPISVLSQFVPTAWNGARTATQEHREESPPRFQVAAFKNAEVCTFDLGLNSLGHNSQETWEYFLQIG